MAGKKTSKKKTPTQKKSSAKKKTPGKTKPAKSKPSLMRRFFRNVTLFVLFVLISVGAGAGYYLIQNWDALRGKPDTRIVKTPGTEKPSVVQAAIPDFEVFPDEPVARPKPPEPRVPPLPSDRKSVV